MALIKRGGVWHFRKMINGNIVARSTKTGDKKQAEQIAAKWETEAVQELVIKGTKPVSVHAAIKAFLNARKGTGGYSSACLHMEWWLKLPNIHLKKIAIHQLQDIVQERIEAGAAHNTVAVTVIYWNALVNFAEKQGWSGGVKLPSMKRQRTRMRILSQDEEVRLLEAIYPKGHYKGKCIKNDIARQANADFVTCLLHTGARYSEIAHMTWDQVDFSERTIFIKRKKNGNDTLLVMSNAVFEVLSRRKATVLGPHIFPSKLNNSNSYKWLDKALEKAEISDQGGKITIHHLRHTFATRMLNSGLSLVEVQSLLGHKHLTSTAVYLHVQKTAVASRAASVLNQMEAMRAHQKNG